MKKSAIELSVVAYTDAAGKSTPGAPRDGNEDNFYVNYGIGSTFNASNSSSEVFRLGENGVLMAVADGMGGMNAGEVASQIAIDTVKDAFENIQLSEAQLSDVNNRRKFLERVIKNADSNIKASAKGNPERENMGSTIILAWLYDNDLTVSWCGDSRMYVFNPKTGIRLISRDHSYVQDLVSKGLLTYDQTFDHPQNNIVTRSLGDPTKDALPESKTVKVGEGDIILLCSDGLSGVLRDRKTYDANGKLLPGQNIEDIIRVSENLKDCRENLWKAAEAEGWYDNVTAILCKIVIGPASPLLKAAPEKTAKKSQSKWKYLCLILGLIIIGILIWIFVPHGAEESPAAADSIQAAKVDTTHVKTIEVPAKEVPTVQKSESHSPSQKKDASKESVSNTPETAPNEAEQPKKDELTKILPKADNLTPIKKKEPRPENPAPAPEQKNENPVIPPIQ
ncbi:MAG: serine/threonine-protein phosphatase [Muribaculaceae bacterium]|nr:serine/threonine-protein phosphatase [Muribaculaceae bacterium]